MCIRDRRNEQAEEAAVELLELFGADAEAEEPAVVGAAERVVQIAARERDAHVVRRRALREPTDPVSYTHLALWVAS